MRSVVCWCWTSYPPYRTLSWCQRPPSCLSSLTPSMLPLIRQQALLHLPRLLRLPRLSSFIEQVELHNLIDGIIDPTFFRLFSFAIYLFLFAHLTGCAWLAVSFLEGLPADSEWVVSEKIRERGSAVSLYIHGAVRPGSRR